MRTGGPHSGKPVSTGVKPECLSDRRPRSPYQVFEGSGPNT
jgi:hypothetical protein